jgi:hypothetical protein
LSVAVRLIADLLACGAIALAVGAVRKLADLLASNPCPRIARQQAGNCCTQKHSSHFHFPSLSSPQAQKNQNQRARTAQNISEPMISHARAAPSGIR